MDNYFQSKQQNKKQLTLKESTEAKKKHDRYHHQKMFQMAAHSMNRIDEYNMNLQTSKRSHDGTIPLIVPTQHQFRDRKKVEELSPHDMTVGNYIPEKQRAERSQLDFVSTHLERDLYDPPPKNKSLRDRELKSESEEMFFGKSRIELDRVNESINYNQSKLDYTEANNKMRHFPEWKSTEKFKWVSKKPFNTVLQDGHSAWNSVPVKLPELKDPYTGGYETAGNLSIKREKSHEIKGPVFNPVVCKDPQGRALVISQSIRTFKQDQELGLGDSLIYSNSSKLQHYNQGLVKTKSVDHLVPISHSNNFQNLEFNRLRPIQKKRVYQKSVVQYRGQLSTDRDQLQATHLNKVDTDKSPRSKGLGGIPEIPYGTQSNFASTKFINYRRRSVEELAINFPYQQMDDKDVQKVVKQYFR